MSIDAAAMAQATNLTRAGRLEEATALIRRVLAREPGVRAASSPAWSGPTLDLEAEPAREAERAWRGQWLRHSYANSFGQRPYKLFVPNRLSEGRVPLLVMLHGCTQHPDDFAVGTGMNALAEEQGFLVVYPEQTKTANATRCWNWFQPEDQQRDHGEPSIIAGITRRVVRDHPVDPRRVYVAGLSAGGAKAVIMAAAYPDLFAGVGVHSGLPRGVASDLPSALAAMRQQGAGRPAMRWAWQVPAIVFHGALDRIVHPANGQGVVRQALADAPALQREPLTGRVASGHAYRRTLYRKADGTIWIEDWLVEGMGHAWSGGSSGGSHTDPKGPDASRAMLAFFRHHRLPSGD